MLTILVVMLVSADRIQYLHLQTLSMTLNSSTDLLTSDVTINFFPDTREDIKLNYRRTRRLKKTLSTSCHKMLTQLGDRRSK